MLEVNELSRSFGSFQAVSEVSFTGRKGEIIGFLGPNGAGKSTTMRMICGYLPPTSGTAVIGGSDIIEEGLAAREKIGYLPENAPVYTDMTVASFLGFCAEIRGFSGADKARKVEETMEKCFLLPVRRQTVGTLSKGFKQRVCFAQSILHDPEYLILDEPTDGLDPNQKAEVRQMIRDMSPDKVIILSTHILDEVESVCTRAVVIHKGRIVADETPEELRMRSILHGAVTFSTRTEDRRSLVAAVERLPDVARAEILEENGAALSVRAFPVDATVPVAGAVMDVLAANNAPIESFFVEKGRLDEAFRAITAD